MSSNIKPYVNQKFKSYLSNCDLINKYNFKKDSFSIVVKNLTAPEKKSNYLQWQ